jgi:hypothetical protein
MSPRRTVKAALPAIQKVLEAPLAVMLDLICGPFADRTLSSGSSDPFATSPPTHITPVQEYIRWHNRPLLYKNISFRS